MEGMNPYNQEAEAALVGAFFLEPELVTECTIRPDQLYSPRLRLLYSAIRSLNEKGKPIDVIAIVEELGPQGVEGIGGISYIVELAGSVPTTAHFTFYQQTVLEYAQKRKTIQIAGKIMEQAQDKDITKTLSDAIADLMAIEQEQTDD